MKKGKKFLALSFLCINILSMSLPVYASEAINTSIHYEDEYCVDLLQSSMSLMPLSSTKAVTVPSCPKCKTNKNVVAHGLVGWACLKCGSYFY